MELSHPIAVLRGMGPKTRASFAKHGIETLEDLLYFFPRGWMDASIVTTIADLKLDVPSLIEVQIVTTKQGMSQRTKIPYLRAVVADTSGSLEVMWFHPRFLHHKVKVGARFLLFGVLHRSPSGPPIMMAPKFIDKARIIPIYSQIDRLPSTKIHAFLLQAKSVLQKVDDYIPESIRQQHGIISLTDALSAMHFPPSVDAINNAKQRLAFNELLMLMVPALLQQQAREAESIASLDVDVTTVESWINSLPFALTGDQQNVIGEVLTDIGQTKPMNRLIQGDVGSGKTVVALAAALATIKSGKQVVWLAPTELLAKQHYETTKKLLLAHNPTVSCALWTRTHHEQVNTSGKDKPTKEDVSQNALIIGTHALLGDGFDFAHLGLLVIDEQHRFGVNQRARLRTFTGKPVHLLSMTATPIPRTMALLVYGDLALSTIKEMPAGRKPVTTRVVTSDNRAKAYDFIRAHMQHGFQAYVVCPTIEPSKDDEANMFVELFEQTDEKKAVTTWHKVLQDTFPEFNLGILHGKLKPTEKAAVMDKFRNKELHMLVSTTVVEVGVDVPNATIMMIEDAEKFGLAQLHQLRGRVGRGDQQSFCFLFPSSDRKADNDRLHTMEDTTDGFILAEKDLELRGPGELTGVAQSGLPQLKFASLQDFTLVSQVKEVAKQLLDEPTFREAWQRFWRMYHPE